MTVHARFQTKEYPMPAIAHLPIRESFNSGTFPIGLHADHRPQDVFFPRTQSPAFRDAEWESRIAPLRSWSQFALWGLAILMFAAAAGVTI
jgi:hypothetical protein